MDTKTLSFTIALISGALTLLIALMAVSRRERGLSIYAVGYGCSFGAFFLFIFQETLSAAFVLVVANMLLVFHYLSLSWGLRTSLKAERRWPRRFWLYLGFWLCLLILGAAGLFQFPARACVSSVLISLCSIEFLISMRSGAVTLPVSIRRFGSAAVVGFICFHALRFAMVLFGSSTAGRLMENNIVNAYTFSFTVFYSVFWAGLILIIDAARLFWEIDKQNKILQELAVTDELTGLSNRHLFEIKVQAEIKRSARYHESLSLIMFDIDYFKRVNDTWGHQTGDVALKSLASITRELIREPDNLFRWGGEEFVILAPHTDLAGAEAMAEKLRSLVESYMFPEVGSLTVSFGVAEWQMGQSKEQWFKQADQALYRAKNTGRNRVVCFGREDFLPIASVRVEWRSEWESGNATIDEEHRNILGMSNSLMDLSLSHGKAEEIKEQLEDLLDHVVKHFSDEERILREIGYPETEAHAELHASLVDEARVLKARTARGDCPPGTFFDFLVGKVVIGHLINEDALFFPFTRRQRAST